MLQQKGDRTTAGRVRWRESFEDHEDGAIKGRPGIGDGLTH